MINETIERPPADIVAGFRDLLNTIRSRALSQDRMGRFNAMTASPSW